MVVGVLIMVSSCVCFSIAGLDKTEMKDQLIQINNVEIGEQHGQAGSAVKQQGLYNTVYQCVNF